jgi:rhodanese-related sulfurtransferase
MQKLDRDTLKHWLGDPGVVILDLRTTSEWEASELKIEHAIHFDPRRPASALARELPKNKKLVLYCINGETHCPTMGQELEKLGFTNVFVLEGGWKAWVGKEYPTVPRILS